VAEPLDPSVGAGMQPETQTAAISVAMTGPVEIALRVATMH
jgi:hypothetical protein